MNTEDINQALRLTVEELTRKLADEVTAKNLLAVQVSQKEEAYQTLQKEKEALETALAKERASSKENGGQ